MEILYKEFYMRDPITVAKELLGKMLVHNVNGILLSGMIVETEAYCGAQDKACHSYGMKRTKRNEVMYSAGGIAYVYLIYGMYYCFNVVTEDAQSPSAVLIRAIEPVSGKDEMAKTRYNLSFDELSKSQKRNLSNGPGKLCDAMRITGEQNGVDLNASALYILDTGEKNPHFMATPRINIGYAQEYVHMPWRFLIDKK